MDGQIYSKEEVGDETRGLSCKGPGEGTEEYDSVEIVKKAEIGVVTNQIPRNMIGKYIAKGDLQGRYFEIRNDGTFELSMYDYGMDRYILFTEEDMDLVVFDTRGYSIIEFRLKVGYEGVFDSQYTVLSWYASTTMTDVYEDSDITYYGYDDDYSR